MALVDCRECGASISNKASTCPQCGVGKPGGGKKSFGAPFAVALITGIGLVILLGTKQTPQASPTAIEAMSAPVSERPTEPIEGETATDSSMQSTDNSEEIASFANGSAEFIARVADAQRGASAPLLDFEKSLADARVDFWNAKFIHKCGFRDDGWLLTVGPILDKRAGALIRSEYRRRRFSATELEAAEAYAKWETHNHEQFMIGDKGEEAACKGIAGMAFIEKFDLLL
jgi:hypothetical protein